MYKIIKWFSILLLCTKYSLGCSKQIANHVDNALLEVRLKEGTENATFLEGRVEVKYRLQWGVVCDDNWDLKDAKVVCRMLGYDKALEASSRAKYGTGSGNLGFGTPKMILDEVNCKGSETTLADCQHAGFKDHNCKPNEAAGAACAKEGSTTQ